MRHITVGRKYNEGKVAKIECVRNDRLQNIDIKCKCFDALKSLSLNNMKDILIKANKAINKLKD